jgi:hypothetical protein
MAIFLPFFFEFVTQKNPNSVISLVFIIWGGGEGVFFIFVISKKLEKLLKFTIEKIKFKRNPNFLFKGNNKICQKKN